jgi:hypothetical protein
MPAEWTLGKSFLHCAGDALFHELNAFRCGVGWSERARSALQSITLTQHTVSRPCNSENEPTLARCDRHRTQHTSCSHTRANGLQCWWFPQHCRPTASKPAGSHHVWDRHLSSSRRWTMDNQSYGQPIIQTTVANTQQIRTSGMYCPYITTSEPALRA